MRLKIVDYIEWRLWAESKQSKVYFWYYSMSQFLNNKLKKQLYNLKNYIQILDETGAPIDSPLITNSLKNIQRFKLELSEIKPLIDNLFESLDTIKLKALAEDFYTTWYASNTELISSVGFSECMEYLTAFHKYLFFTWPGDALAFLDSNGMDATITVYRGTTESLNAKKDLGISWTTLPHIAENYARNRNGYVKHAEVSMNDILIYMSEESEILVLPCNIKMLNIYKVK